MEIAHVIERDVLKRDSDLFSELGKGWDPSSSAPKLVKIKHLASFASLVIDRGPICALLHFVDGFGCIFEGALGSNKTLEPMSLVWYREGSDLALYMLAHKTPRSRFVVEDAANYTRYKNLVRILWLRGVFSRVVDRTAALRSHGGGNRRMKESGVRVKDGGDVGEVLGAQTPRKIGRP
ncbi:hypothetical protein HG530_014626 [Fusarium avenaceum]|nr:hypothetical protein HG530_014626 [Fusarium avenaceum]